MSLPKPYYEEPGIQIYHGDCREILPFEVDVLLTDPPYGIGYKSGWEGKLARSIEGDLDTEPRDQALALQEGTPALVFGTYRSPAPTATRQILIWDTKGALGMGDLSLPWKPSHQQIHVIGSGFTGRRDTDVLSYAPVQATAKNGRLHPHQKPLALIVNLLGKCPPGVVLDPFMGSGTTLLAAKNLGRKAIGIEVSEEYCQIAARRLQQEVLPLEVY